MEKHKLDYINSKISFEKLLIFLENNNFSIKDLNRAWTY